MDKIPFQMNYYPQIESLSEKKMIFTSITKKFNWLLLGTARTNVRQSEKLQSVIMFQYDIEASLHFWRHHYGARKWFPPENGLLRVNVQ